MNLPKNPPKNKQKLAKKTANGLLKELAKNDKLAKEPTKKQRAELTGRFTETRTNPQLHDSFKAPTMAPIMISLRL
ncbi:hypothetical protein C2G38_2225816 [Gigaspora rosea]|uniref:Uncharacterized protein n=1 Tax=Gigaspora rosea TaxID=44941 RepID=A0A397U212_9GLOM|nr:hypothetical protein C2G38_2225816 [Gigaspora rosea]